MAEDLAPVVIDTNVYIASAINPNGAVASALDNVEQKRVPIIQTKQTLEELREKLITNPSAKIIRLIPEDQRKLMYERAQKGATMIEAAPNFSLSRDVKDNMFVDAAIAGRATHILSLDHDLSVLKNVRGIGHLIEIVTPSAFVDHLKAVAERDLRKKGPAVGLEHHASQGVGAASMVVNVAEGNYGAAGLDAAGVVAETKLSTRLIESAEQFITHGGAKKFFNGLAQGAKRVPLLGAVVTTGFVINETWDHYKKGETDLASGALAAGLAEIAGNGIGFGVGDAARESVREVMIRQGGSQFENLDKSGLRQLGEEAFAVGQQTYHTLRGQDVNEVLPANHAAMAQGGDDMGDRNEVNRIVVERTGYRGMDARNDMLQLSQDNGHPRAHLLILDDGTVQGPERGGVAFDANPQIAAGKNGGSLGLLYAGDKEPNPAQTNTIHEVEIWLRQQRFAAGYTSPIEMIAGSTATADMLHLPTPRGPLPHSMLSPSSSPQLLTRPQASNGM